MRKKKTLKIKSYKIKNSTKLGFVLILICFFCFQLFQSFNQNITPKLIEIAKRNIDKFTYNLLNNYSLISSIDQFLLDNILIIEKNKENEIIAVNYNMKNAYAIENILVESLKKDYSNSKNNQNNIEYYDDLLSKESNSFVISLPMGLASNFIFLSNLGPKIPVKIKFIGSVLTNIKTRITDYGINNALIEIFVEIEITQEIITPVTFENNKLKYEILIDAKIINGEIPSYYSGSLETKSNILNVPIQ